jgi:hypothetical protein
MRKALLLMLGMAGCSPPDMAEHPPADAEALLVESAYPMLLGVIGADSAPREFLVWRDTTAFDRRVSAALENSPMRLPVSDSVYALYVATRGVRYTADSAAITVETGQCYPGDDEFNWWHGTDELVFIRRGDAWEFLHHRPLGGGDGPCFY